MLGPLLLFLFRSHLVTLLCISTYTNKNNLCDPSRHVLYIALVIAFNIKDREFSTQRQSPHSSVKAQEGFTYV